MLFSEVFSVIIVCDAGMRKQREVWLVVCPVAQAKFNMAVKEFPSSRDIRLVAACQS